MNLNLAMFKCFPVNIFSKFVRSSLSMLGMLLTVLMLCIGYVDAKTINVNVYQDRVEGIRLVHDQSVSRSWSDGIARAEVELWKDDNGLQKLETDITDRFGQVSLKLPEEDILGKYYVRVISPRIEGIISAQTWSHASVKNPLSAIFSRRCQLESAWDLQEKPFATERDTGVEFCRGGLVEKKLSLNPNEWGSYSIVEITQENIENLTLSFGFDTYMSKAIAPDSYNQGALPYHLSHGEWYSSDYRVFGLGVNYGANPASTQLEFPDPDDESYWPPRYLDNDGVYVKATHEKEYGSLQNARLMAGETYDFKVYTSSNSADAYNQTASLNGWIDWTSTGSLGHFREQIVHNVQDRPLSSEELSTMPYDFQYLDNAPRIITFSYTLPSSSTAVSDVVETYARFRFSNIKDLGPVGQGNLEPGVDYLLDGGDRRL